MTSHSKHHSVFHFLNVYQRMKSDERGASGIIVMMIMLAIVFLMIGGVAFFGMDDLETGYAEWRSSDSVLAAQSCTEEAIVRMKRDSDYTGGNLAVGNSVCSIAIVGTPCGQCTINVTAKTGLYTRRLQTEITKSGAVVTITSLKEID